jgi:hypothetical protein
MGQVPCDWVTGRGPEEKGMASDSYSGCAVGAFFNLVNGTGVPDKVTLRPYRTSPSGS